MSDERDFDDLQAMIKAYQNAPHGLPPTIKPIDKAQMGITLGTFNEAIKTAERMGAEIAVNCCLEMIANNPALIFQPAPYPRRILEDAVKAELENKNRERSLQPPLPLEGERRND